MGAGFCAVCRRCNLDIFALQHASNPPKTANQGGKPALTPFQLYRGVAPAAPPGRRWYTHQCGLDLGRIPAADSNTHSCANRNGQSDHSCLQHVASEPHAAGRNGRICMDDRTSAIPGVAVKSDREKARSHHLRLREAPAPGTVSIAISGRPVGAFPLSGVLEDPPQFLLPHDFLSWRIRAAAAPGFRRRTQSPSL